MIHRVRAWRDHLRALPPAGTSLSPAGAQAAWDAALDALSDDALAEAAAVPGRPFATACVVVAGTVPTAAIEWCAALALRGTQVTIKHPTGHPGVLPLLVDAARHAGLPITATDDRAAVGDADLVAVMGSDETVRAIRAAARADARVLAHGHRFSVAWVAEEGSFFGLAEDAALQDGRGCLSPVVAFSPRADALDRLATACAEVARRWPVGQIDPIEGAEMRSREALARVTGATRSGAGWSIHQLPLDRVVPIALPRSVLLVRCDDPAAAACALGPWGRHLSTIGTDDHAAADAFIDAGASRVCSPGQMQRPPLVRVHDGEEWLRTLVRAVGDETRR